jgi:hypothetical protein
MKGCLNVQRARKNSQNWKNANTAARCSVGMIIRITWLGSDVIKGWRKKKENSGASEEKHLHNATAPDTFPL